MCSTRASIFFGLFGVIGFFAVALLEPPRAGALCPEGLACCPCDFGGESPACCGPRQFPRKKCRRQCAERITACVTPYDVLYDCKAVTGRARRRCRAGLRYEGKECRRDIPFRCLILGGADCPAIGLDVAQMATFADPARPDRVFAVIRVSLTADHTDEGLGVDTLQFSFNYRLPDHSIGGSEPLDIAAGPDGSPLDSCSPRYPMPALSLPANGFVDCDLVYAIPSGQRTTMLAWHGAAYRATRTLNLPEPSVIPGSVGLEVRSSLVTAGPGAGEKLVVLDLQVASRGFAEGIAADPARLRLVAGGTAYQGRRAELLPLTIAPLPYYLRCDPTYALPPNASVDCAVAFFVPAMLGTATLGYDDGTHATTTDPLALPALPAPDLSGTWSIQLGDDPSRLQDCNASLVHGASEEGDYLWVSSDCRYLDRSVGLATVNPLAHTFALRPYPEGDCPIVDGSYAADGGSIAGTVACGTTVRAFVGARASDGSVVGEPLSVG